MIFKTRRNSIISQLRQLFKLQELGDVKHILGITVERDLNKREMKLSQENYISNLEIKYKNQYKTRYKTPTSENLVQQLNSNKYNNNYDNTRYRALLGSLPY